MKFKLYEGRRTVPHTKAEMQGILKKEPEVQPEVQVEVPNKNVKLPKGLVIVFAYEASHFAFMLNPAGDAYVPFCARDSSGEVVAVPLDDDTKYTCLEDFYSSPIGIYGYAHAKVATDITYATSYEHYSKDAIFAGYGEIIWTQAKVDVRLFSTSIPQETDFPDKIQATFSISEEETIAGATLLLGEALAQVVGESYNQEETMNNEI